MKGVITPYPFRQKTECWRKRVEAARRQYDLTVTQFRKVLAEQKNWPLPAPDGSTAVRKARLQRSAALNEYMRTLRIFTDLTVYGKVPEDDKPVSS
jgi:predicted nucleic acid-binding Zn ribbon protein